jgi:hypothetical protein
MAIFGRKDHSIAEAGGENVGASNKVFVVDMTVDRGLVMSGTRL